MSKLTLTSVFLTVLAAVLGLNAIDDTNELNLMGLAKTPLNVGLGPAQYAGLVGSLLFAVLTLMLLSRDRRHKSTVLLDTARNRFWDSMLSSCKCGVFTKLNTTVKYYP